MEENTEQSGGFELRAGSVSSVVVRIGWAEEGRTDQNCKSSRC